MTTTANTNTTALAPAPAADADAAALAALGEAAGDGDLYDGYSQSIGTDKFRIPRRVFNQSRGTDAHGNRLQVDMFFDPVAQTTARTIDAILILEHTTRAYTTFDEDKQETKVICSSRDCVTGIEAATGKARTCKGCPDAKWRVTPKGKRALSCNEAHQVLAVDMATREPFVISFRRTAAPVLINHIQRYHHQKRELPGGGKANLPLYWRRVTLALALADNGKYATPVIKVTGVTSVEDMRMCRETLDALKSIMIRVDHDAADAGVPGGGDTTFDPEEFDRS